MPHREPVSDQSVVLWRCPKCGGIDPDTGQKARFCGRSRACTSTSRSGAIVTSTKMERVEYVPLAERDRYREALVQIQEIAAREWKADETNYEWYGDIAGIAEEVLGIDIWASAASDERQSDG